MEKICDEKILPFIGQQYLDFSKTEVLPFIAVVNVKWSCDMCKHWDNDTSAKAISWENEGSQVSVVSHSTHPISPLV